ncbi:MAG TPA: ArsB/NhaD family transporter [Thermomicrobiales bacterium]|nr:ArsB/NhaD family transporter [Thermomicrobiales bacterium]HRA32328.1 ArsB/NhaD family transporter [Thermomicrobiales bacterium]
MSDLALATIIFVVTYTVIITERIDRTTAAVAGALIMVLAGVINQQQAIAAIDFNTIGLLIGMMIIVSILKRTGIFAHLGFTVARWTGGRVMPMLLTLALMTAVASAFLDNVTTVLLMVPVTIALCELLGLPATPFLMTQVIASNIGGTATLIGDPPNILIGSATGLDFVSFLVNLGPIVLVILAVAAVAAAFHYRHIARTDIERHAELIASAATQPIEDPVLLRKSLAVLGITLVGFLLHGMLHLEAATVALGGAALLLLISRVEPHHVFLEIEWSTIFFFAGLFVLVGGIKEMGLLDRLATHTIDLTGGNVTFTILALIWLAAALSAVVDNIPAVTTLIPLTFAVARLLFPDLAGLSNIDLAQHAQVTPLWWALALGACLGGNATLIGASANVVAAGVAERHGETISFWGFTRVGLPVTLGSLILATGYIWLRYLA